MSKIRRFLLADDDEDDTILFAEALETIDPSIEFESVSNGKHLLEKLKTFDDKTLLIFLDINMPEMNGWDTLKNLKRSEDLRNIPVIMYSTSYSAIEGKNALTFGALGFYEKPPSFFKLKDFLQLIAASSFDELVSNLKVISQNQEHRIYLG